MITVRMRRQLSFLGSRFFQKKGEMQMFKYDIFNMKEFLKAINECEGAVNMIEPNGLKKNINNRQDIQSELMKRYKKNKNCLSICLDIPEQKDYFSIVCYAIGDY